MANTVNLTAETGANLIGDDSSPALTLENSSSGQALKLQNAGGTGVALSIVSTPTTALHVAGANVGAVIRSGASESVAIDIANTMVGSVTVAPIRVTTSGVSGAVLELKGTAFTSAVTSGSVVGAIRVKYGDNYYWIPITGAIATS